MLNLKLEASPTKELLDTIESGLDEYNDAKGMIWDEQQVVISATDSSGVILGGLYGRTLFSWLNTKHLWVDKSLRGQGWGEKLVAAAEEEAKKRGCIGAQLDTFSFQAADFYKKIGYEVFGELQNYPPGESRVYLKKFF